MVSSNAFWKNIYTFDFCPKSICDAQGNQMATYTVLNEYPIVWQSSPIGVYPAKSGGSSRVGVFEPNMELSVNADANDVSHTCTWLQSQPQNYYEYEIYRGIRKYELSNHLGNVLVVISDKRSSVCVSGLIDHYEADVLQAADYYCFGSPMTGRTWVASGVGDYRFGYNGKEKDNEINVDGGIYQFELRVYDSRIGRWFSTDPRKDEYAWQSTYAYFKNTPLSIIDYLGGGEIWDDQSIENTTDSYDLPVGNLSLGNEECINSLEEELILNLPSQTGVSPPIRITMPTWDDVNSNWPYNSAGTDDKPAYQVFKDIWGSNFDEVAMELIIPTGRVSMKNACAARLSIALNLAGVPVKKNWLATEGSLAGKGVITRAIDMYNWLSKPSVFGRPTETFDLSVISFTNIQATLSGRKGIYIMIAGNPSLFGATGHVSLWTGTDAVGEHNYNLWASYIYFWELR